MNFCIVDNLRYHLLNIAAVTLFSYTSAQTINQGVRFYFRENMRESKVSSASRVRKNIRRKERDGLSIEEYRRAIIGSGFFKIGAESGDSSDSGVKESAPGVPVDDLFLVGTITGHSSIARAMIRNRREKDPVVYRLWQEVYGYRLVKIARERVFLKAGDRVEKIGIYDKREKASLTANRGAILRNTRGVIRKNISRAEIKQRVMNNLDNAMRGLVAGPYRRGGVIAGFRLQKVRPYNILYKLGVRSGDIVKRINGKTVDSVNKLYSMWQSLKDESKIVVDLDRRGKLLQFEYNIQE